MLIIYGIATLIVGIAIGILITANVESLDYEKRERQRRAEITPEMQQIFIQAGPQRALEYFNRDVYRTLMELQKKP